MRMTMHRSVVSRMFPATVCLLTAVSVLFMAACSTAKRENKLLYEGVSSASGAYRKILAVLPFENSVPWATSGLDGTFTQELKRVIEKKCSKVRVVTAEDPDFPASFGNPARLPEGDLDTAALTSSGRESGINLALTGRLVSVRHVTEDRGMFWFAKVAHLVKIQMEVAVHHTGTGARLLNTGVFHDIEITEEEGSLIDAGSMPESVMIREALVELSDSIGETACNVIRHIPWEGYVAGVEGDRITLSNGASCGLKKGNVLTVFNVNDVTVEETGQRFFSPGTEIGRITITEVSPNRSVAIVKEGGPILPGSLVRTQ